MASVIKCVVIGDGAVGKTCMLISYTTNRFPSEYVPTIFDNYSAQLTIDDEIYTFTLYDTAGQEEFSELRKIGYKETDVFLVCFSVMRKDSFGNIKSRWLPELMRHCQGTPFILVGTQIDLRTNRIEVERLQQRRQQPISYEAGAALAKEIKAAKYCECSSLTQVGLKNVFDEAIKTALSNRKKPKKRKCILQ